MGLFEVLSLLGGLAIFLFGMQVMGDALERRGGGKLKAILESLTSSPIKGVLLGAGVTAIIQSSSATTVMVVGFINSGIMRLGQGISVIMGANIGTTITSWLLSLTGLESKNIFVQLLKPSSFAPVLAVIGIVMIMFVKNRKKQDTGYIFVGFAVLMTGMELMSSAVSGLKDNEQFTQILTLFTNPVLGIAAGAILTAVIQSSSASVGILQALSTTGSITYGNAIPIILGQNIGTCVTALLSAIGANKNARRASVVHLSFNIIGTACFMILFYTGKAFIGFGFVEYSIDAAGIAVVHTIFNVFSTIVMFPFIKQLEKLSKIIIRDNPGEGDTMGSVLDDRLLATPPVALNQAKKVANRMAEVSAKCLEGALTLMENYDSEAAQRVKELEEQADKYEDILGTYLVKLSRESLSSDDNREISTLLHCIGDFERISDHAANIAESAQELTEKEIVFSDDAIREIRVMKGAIGEIMECTCAAFVGADPENAMKTEPLEQVTDNLKNKLRANHIDRLKRNECTIETGFVFSDLITDFERIADHCSNISVCILSAAQDSFDTHEYLHHVKQDGENRFRELYDMYAKKYTVM